MSEVLKQSPILTRFHGGPGDGWSQYLRPVGDHVLFDLRMDINFPEYSAWNRGVTGSIARIIEAKDAGHPLAIYLRRLDDRSDPAHLVYLGEYPWDFLKTEQDYLEEAY